LMRCQVLAFTPFSPSSFWDRWCHRRVVVCFPVLTSNGIRFAIYGAFTTSICSFLSPETAGPCPRFSRFAPYPALDVRQLNSPSVCPPGWLATVNASSTLWIDSDRGFISARPSNQFPQPHHTRSALGFVVRRCRGSNVLLRRVRPGIRSQAEPSRTKPSQTAGKRAEDTQGARVQELRPKHADASFSPFFPPPCTPTPKRAPHANSGRCCFVAMIDDPFDWLVAVPVRLEIAHCSSCSSILVHTRTTLIAASDDENALTTLYVE
jgi:hypothetical protein